MKTIPLHGVVAAGRVALVDDEDYELVMRHRWHAWERKGKRPSGPYAVSGIKQPDGSYRKIPMHRLITGLALTDHDSGDSLDNRRSNLRPASISQNQHNQRPQQGGTSQYKGVSWHKATEKWIVRIKIGGVRRYLGIFNDEREAALAYDRAARELFAEYARPNFPADQA